jgi:hypothetical protein
LELVQAARMISYTCARTIVRQRWAARKIPKELEAANKEIRNLHALSKAWRGLSRGLWLDRNKPSRMRDVIREFVRHEAEYFKLLSAVSG